MLQRNENTIQSTRKDVYALTPRINYIVHLMNYKQHWKLDLRLQRYIEYRVLFNQDGCLSISWQIKIRERKHRISLKRIS